MKKVIKIIANSILYLFVGLAAFIFISAVTCVVKGEIPSVFGYSIFIVQTPSMEDTIMVGDVIISKKATVDEINENDIITFICIDENEPVAGQVITHRAIKVENINGEINITTKGDNNVVADKKTVTSINIYGKVVYYSSIGGKLIDIFSKVGFFIVLAIILVFIGMGGYKIYLTYKNDLKQEEEKERLEQLKKDLLKEILEESKHENK